VPRCTKRSGAEIARDYRDIMRKLRGVVAPYEKPTDQPNFKEEQALEELMRITLQEG